MKQIHWFPGHMKKAQNDIGAKLKIVDVIIELLDARIPFSSRNIFLYNMTKDKTRLVVLTKKDLADPDETEKWETYYKSRGFSVVFADLNNQEDVKSIIRGVEELGTIKNEKYIAKGMKPQAVRAMIIGIPNVGKSTLINKIAGRKAASVENRPGKTVAQQWIKVSNSFELLDTPGVLQANYTKEQKAINLALMGSMKNDILPTDQLAALGLIFMIQNYKKQLLARYPYINLNKNVEEAFREIAKRRGYLTKEGEDIAKAQEVFLNELKNGILGRITLERTDDVA